MIQLFRENLNLLLSLILLTILSVYFSIHNGISLDETTSIQLSHYVLKGEWKYLLQDIHTLFYNLILILVMKVFGTSLMVLRSVTIAGALLSLVALDQFMKKNFDQRSNYTTLVLTTSLSFIFYSTYGRSYSLLCLNSILSMYFYLNYLKSDSRRNLTFYLMSSVLLIYTHVIGLLILLTQSIHYLIQGKSFRTDVVKWTKIQLIIFLSFTPVFVAVFTRFNILKDLPVIYSWVAPVNSHTLMESLKFLCGDHPVAWLLWCVSFLFLLIKVLRGKLKGPELLMVLWVLVPYSFVLIYSLTFHPILILRGLISSTIPMAVAVSLTSNEFKKVMVSLGLTGLLIILTWTAVFQRGPQGQGWEKILDEAYRESKTVTIAAYPPHFIYPVLFIHKSQCFYEINFYDCARSEGYLIVNQLSEFDRPEFKNGHYKIISSLAHEKELKEKFEDKAKFISQDIALLVEIKN